MATINVTQEHIDNGQLCRARYCPVALATNNILKSTYETLVTRGYIYITHRSASFFAECIPTPMLVLIFMSRFDREEKDELLRPTPFSFELNIPQEYLK